MPKAIVMATANPETVVKSAATPAGSATSRCRTIGPIKDAADADLIVAAIAGQATPISLRQDSRPHIDGYQILSPQQASVKDARALTEKMTAAGFNDFYVFKSGPHQGRVSLGVYRDQQRAEDARASLADLGFATELFQRTQPQSGFWLEVELLKPAKAMDLSEATQSLGGTTRLTATSCDLVTAQK